MNRTRSEDWFAEAERSFEVLRGKTDEIFLMGLSLGGCIALRIAELRGAAVRGLVVRSSQATRPSAETARKVTRVRFIAVSQFLPRL